MSGPWILGIDLGTSGLKVAAVSPSGEVLGRGTTALVTHYGEGGAATQDPDDWWAGIQACTHQVLLAGVRPGDLAGIGITGQWGSTVPVCEDGRPAGPCLLWSDTSGSRHAARAVGGPVSVLGYGPGKMLSWLRLTGGAPSPHGADPLGHELHLRHDEPAVYARTAVLLEPLDYVGMLLTGLRAASPASMILSWLTDNRAGARPGYSSQLVKLSGRDPLKLPELVPTGSVLGGLTESAGAALGLPAGKPVIAGVPDLHSAYLGSGHLEPYEGHITISTSGWISCAVPSKRTDVLHQMASVPGTWPGSYLVANNHETAGACLQWLGSALGTAGYDELTERASASAPGAGGVLFTPWLNGERSPVEDRTLRGAFLNLSMTTRSENLVRAVMEGVAFNARWLLDAVEGFVGRALPTLRMLGGGAQSSLWCQIHADILDRRIEVVADPVDANVRGAALLAGLSLGLIERERLAGCAPVAAVHEPDPSLRAVYDPMSREFSRLYKRLRGFYSAMNR